MPPYRLARLSDEQMTMVESLENEIGVTLVAYEPACDAVRATATQDVDRTKAPDDLMTDDLTTDALLDSYRTYDPL